MRWNIIFIHNTDWSWASKLSLKKLFLSYNKSSPVFNTQPHLSNCFKQFRTSVTNLVQNYKFYVWSIIAVEENWPLRDRTISRMLKIISFVFYLNFVICENANNYIYEKRNKNSYYFRLGKTNNEVKVNNKIYFLNHNITDIDYPNGRVANMKKVEEPPIHVSVE